MKYESVLELGQIVYYVFGDPKNKYSIIKSEVTEVTFRFNYNGSNIVKRYVLHLLKCLKGDFPIGGAYSGYCWQTIYGNCINPKSGEMPVGGFATFTDKEKCKEWLNSFKGSK